MTSFAMTRSLHRILSLFPILTLLALSDAGTLGCGKGCAKCCFCKSEGGSCSANTVIESSGCLDCASLCKAKAAEIGCPLLSSEDCTDWEGGSRPAEVFPVDPGTPTQDVPTAKTFKMDLLVIVDDSPSMCQEQQTLARLFGTFSQALGDADFRVAVTSTNVCAKDKPGAVRGKFLYAPATEFPPDCVEKRVVACTSDAECQGIPGLPEPSDWACESKPANVHVCDKGPDPVVLDAVTSKCRYACTKDADDCAAVFGDPAYRCLYPGGDATRSGCVKPPQTATCPVDGPKVLDPAVVDNYLDAWKAGSWAGDPEWTGKTDAEVRPLVRDRLFSCMATIGSAQTICGNEEQGLLAAFLALDPAGENADQAKAFLRSDAVLVVFLVTDEDDCSASGVVKFESYGRCACLADTKGCLPEGSCGQVPGPLFPVADLAAKLRSLKTDPAKVVFAAATGDVVPGSATTPGSDATAARKRFYECKCADSTYSPYNYACFSSSGLADLGSRVQAMAAEFGSNGLTTNLCEADGIGKSLVWAAQAARRAAGL